jgi:hypothetical protein
MKTPQKPPPFDELLASRAANMERLSSVLAQAKARLFDSDFCGGLRRFDVTLPPKRMPTGHQRPHRWNMANGPCFFPLTALDHARC